MRHISDLRRALSDDVETMQIPAGLERRVLDALLLQSKAATRADSSLVGRRVASRMLASRSKAPRAVALAAALLAIAIVVTLLLAGHVLHPNRPVPLKNPRAEAGTATLQIDPMSSFFSPSDGAVIEYSCAYANCSFNLESQRIGPLLITHDGGRTWVSVPLDQFQLGLVYSIQWVDAQHLIVFEPDRNRIEMTADGGYTWQTTSSPVPAGGAFFVDLHQGWAVSQSAVYRTLDSGAHWQQIGSAIAYPNTQPGRIEFIDATHGFMGTWSTDGVGRLLMTDDGGNSWRLIQLPAPAGGWRSTGASSYCGATACVEPPTMFGNRGVLVVKTAVGDFTYTTADGGSTWRDPHPMPVASSPASTWSYSAADSEDWWFLEDEGLFRTKDQGMTWQRISSVLPMQYTLTSVTAVGGDVLWGTAINALGSPPWPLRSTDGGVHWTPVLLPRP